MIFVFILNFFASTFHKFPHVPCFTSMVIDLENVLGIVNPSSFMDVINELQNS